MDIHLFSPLGEIYAHLVLKLKPLTKKKMYQFIRFLTGSNYISPTYVQELKKYINKN